MPKQTKVCVGCGDNFLTFKNYDYCVDCAVNNNRYLTNSNCAECDGSGWIKFRNQKSRPCKLCYLTKKTMPNFKKNNSQKLTAEEQAEQFWTQVDLQAQEKIHHLFTTIIPFQNIKLIPEPWKFEDRQSKLTGLFLDRDVDYRTLLSDMESQYDEEELPEQEYLAEEIALCYCRLVIKSLITNLSDYSSYDPSYFENLIQ